MSEKQMMRLVKRTLFGYAFFIGLCLAFCLYLGYSYHALHQVQQEYQHTLLQEELPSAHR
jgi:hypothetical protein